jgi:hypothetical protein
MILIEKQAIAESMRLKLIMFITVIPIWKLKCLLKCIFKGLAMGALTVCQKRILVNCLGGVAVLAMPLPNSPETLVSAFLQNL